MGIAWAHTTTKGMARSQAAPALPGRNQGSNQGGGSSSSAHIYYLFRSLDPLSPNVCKPGITEDLSRRWMQLGRSKWELVCSVELGAGEAYVFEQWVLREVFSEQRLNAVGEYLSLDADQREHLVQLMKLKRRELLVELLGQRRKEASRLAAEIHGLEQLVEGLESGISWELAQGTEGLPGLDEREERLVSLCNFLYVRALNTLGATASEDQRASVRDRVNRVQQESLLALQAIYEQRACPTEAMDRKAERVFAMVCDRVTGELSDLCPGLVQGVEPIGTVPGWAARLTMVDVRQLWSRGVNVVPSGLPARPCSIERQAQRLAQFFNGSVVEQ